MWRLKTCPKCSGDIYAEEDSRTWFEKCLQCGYMREREVALATEVVNTNRGRLSYPSELKKVTLRSRP